MVTALGQVQAIVKINLRVEFSLVTQKIKAVVLFSPKVVVQARIVLVGAFTSPRVIHSWVRNLTVGGLLKSQRALVPHLQKVLVSTKIQVAVVVVIITQIQIKPLVSILNNILAVIQIVAVVEVASQLI